MTGSRESTVGEVISDRFATRELDNGDPGIDAKLLYTSIALLLTTLSQRCY
jgi:hypothetical protein